MSDVSCGGSLVKYLLFFFNFLWLILGGAIIWLGFTINYKLDDFRKIAEEGPHDIVIPKESVIILLAVGFAIFFIAFLGCCGACKESSCMLNLYATIILLLVILECVGAYYAFTTKKDIRKFADESLMKTFEKFKNETKVRDVINEFQLNLKCCGAKEPKDWEQLNSGSPTPYPSSCCKNEKQDCRRENVKPDLTGCVDAIESIINKMAGLAGVAIGVILVQLLIVMAACCLAREANH